MEPCLRKRGTYLYPKPTAKIIFSDVLFLQSMYFRGCTSMVRNTTQENYTEDLKRQTNIQHSDGIQENSIIRSINIIKETAGNVHEKNLKDQSLPHFSIHKVLFLCVLFLLRIDNKMTVT